MNTHQWTSHYLVLVEISDHNLPLEVLAAVLWRINNAVKETCRFIYPPNLGRLPI